MSRGNWTAGLFIDKRASIYAVKALTQDLHRQGRRHHVAAVHPGRQVPGRRAGADHLRDGGPHTRVFQIPKIIEGAVTPIPGKEPGRRHGDQQLRILDRAGNHRGAGRQEPHAGLRPQLEFRRPLGRDLQAGLARTVTEKQKQKAHGPHSDAEEESHMAAGARLFGPSADRVRLVPGFPVAGRGQRGALDGDVLVAGAGALRRRHRRADRPQAGGQGDPADLVGRTARQHHRLCDLRADSRFRALSARLHGRGPVVPVGGDHRGVERRSTMPTPA